ncbi:MAG: hypothetical protein K2Y71_16810 [Xanthobacteraceae bacterium]|nr:hypothetical protein [Xanthobacteraceae bacterium]
MFTQHPTLLIGPSDWDESRAPKAAFDARIAALWAAFPNATQAIVFGSVARHAELAYLTNFVPKLEPGIALLSRDGSQKLLFGGGPNMIGAMKPLTFIADMAPLNALAKLIAGWKSPLLVGGGAMTSAMRKTVDDATGNTAQDATAHVQSLMRRKSPDELACIRDACGVLGKVVTVMRDAVRAGHGAATALLAGERAAIDQRVQDIRTLYSLDGGRTLRPFEAIDDRRVDPLQVYVAVRKYNYWADGFACLPNEPQPAASLAALLLDNALSAIKPGVPVAQLAKILAVGAPYCHHPVIEDALAAPIGLSLDAPTTTRFEPGEVYSVRAGLTDGAEQHAILSAMIAVHDTDTEVLWRAAVA